MHLRARDNLINSLDYFSGSFGGCQEKTDIKFEIWGVVVKMKVPSGRDIPFICSGTFDRIQMCLKWFNIVNHFLTALYGK